MCNQIKKGLLNQEESTKKLILMICYLKKGKNRILKLLQEPLTFKKLVNKSKRTDILKKNNCKMKMKKNRIILNLKAKLLMFHFSHQNLTKMHINNIMKKLIKKFKEKDL
jgi:hypothetical protein